MTNNRDTLSKISDAIIGKLRALSSRAEVEKVLDVIDYHGFGKSRLPSGFIDDILDRYRLTQHDVQIEVVRVTTDLTHEIHYHEHAYAFVIVMGTAEHLDEPSLAKSYHDNEWFPVTASQVIDIPAGTPHGFTVEENGILWFLSIQSPPIVNEIGQDDYHKLN